MDKQDTSNKPLPLKQRTSSVDCRRDYNNNTLLSLLRIIKPREYFISIDHFSIWRRHLAWAIENGGDLKQVITQRYSSSMVFMSLLLGAELGVLFNSATVTTRMRQSLQTEAFYTLSFWFGMTILISVILTIISLISTFTAWGMVSSISQQNAHCVLRSSIGQYVAELPGRLIVVAIYAFLLWVIQGIFLLLPIRSAIMLVLITIILFIHVIATFSSFGRLIIHTGAMGCQKIFDSDFERDLLPRSLHQNLSAKAFAQLKTNTSIIRQYRQPYQPLKRSQSADTIASNLIEERSTYGSLSMSSRDQSRRSNYNSRSEKEDRPHQVKRTPSVRFSDTLLSGRGVSSSSYTIDVPMEKQPLSLLRKSSSSSSGSPKLQRPPKSSPPQASIKGGNNIRNGNSTNIEAWLSGTSSEVAVDNKDSSLYTTPIAPPAGKNGTRESRNSIMETPNSITPKQHNMPQGETTSFTTDYNKSIDGDRSLRVPNLNPAALYGPTVPTSISAYSDRNTSVSSSIGGTSSYYRMESNDEGSSFDLENYSNNEDLDLELAAASSNDVEDPSRKSEKEALLQGIRHGYDFSKYP